MPLLEVKNVTRRFGGIVALDDVSFDVGEGEIVGLIGPNGAGKTTAFNVITRLYRPDTGELNFEGETLLSTPPHGVDPPRDRADVPEPRALQDDDRPRERHGRHARALRVAHGGRGDRLRRDRRRRRAPGRLARRTGR